MNSNTEYFTRRLLNHDLNIKQLQLQLTNNSNSTTITGKKRKYEEALGYSNDYEVVQESKNYLGNRGINWIDAYLENLSNKLET